MHFVKDDVVISGIGGYFPKALNVEEFRDRLLNNENLMTSRWKAGERGVTNVIGTVPTEYFDSGYFGIHRQQCTFMDPMHRLILERTFEALIDAGVNPVEVRGKRIGCFMGSSVGENDNLFLESVVSGFGVTGHSRAMMPNRVSYWLDLKGPSVAYDSNWIGGIEVLRLAYEAVKTGQCDSVLVGTANLALNSEFQWLYNDLHVISPDGSTKSFDADAQGYARSDGIVVLYIQRASEARRSYASIVNVATQFDGDRDGPLLDIDSNNLAEFINEFYNEIDVDPNEVEFVETYGCALKETDRKELDALEKVYCKNRKEPLLIGSVKPNAGHSEASASLFSVVKVLIAMETGIIPATIQYKTPNPELKPLINGTIQLVTENRKWGVKYAAVNALGLDSYYGHILLKANPKVKVVSEVQDKIPRLVLASTRTEEGIKNILETIKSKPSIDVEYIQLIQDLYSKPILGHLYRGYTILGTENSKDETDYHLGNKRQIWFVFSGMGSQWCGMISDLMQLPVFANAVNKCHKILLTKGVDLLHIISTDDKKIFDNILHSFVGIAAIQIGLTDVLKSVGIVPDGIIGHSVGELGCAYADGCMTAEEMILSAYSRGRASLEASLIKGMMAAIGMGYQQIKDKCPPSIEVACHNGPDSSTISGPTEDMEKFVKELQEQGVFARLVNVSNIAYHSRYIKPAAPLLLEYLKKVLPNPIPRSSKWISTSNKEEDWDTEQAKHSSPEYHTNNLLSSVLFEEGLKHIPKDSVLIEIAPHGLLQAILKRSLKSGCTNVPLTQRGSASGVEFLLSALGKLYLAGLDMDVSNLFPKIEYPVSRGTACLANLSHWEHSETWRTGLEEKLKSLYGVRDFQVTLNSEEFRDCVGHQVDNKIILSPASYLSIIFNIVASISTGQKEYVFENIHFRKMLTVPRIGSVSVHAMIQKGSGDFEILTGNDILVTGRLTFPSGADKVMMESIKVEETETSVYLTSNDVYNEFQHRGYKYSGQYKTIKNLTITENGSSSVVQWSNKWVNLVEAMIQQQLFLAGERRQEVYVPKNIHKIVINEEFLPSEKTDVVVHHDLATGLISTEGAQIVGIKSVPFTRDPKAISFDSVEFSPFSSTSLPSIESGINTALHLTLENDDGQFGANISITEIETRNPSLLDNIRNVCEQYAKLNPNINQTKDTKFFVNMGSYPFLIVLNDTATEEVVNVIAKSRNGTLLVRNSKNLSSYSEVVQLAQFNVGGVDYSIVRRSKTASPAVVTVRGDTLSIRDLSRSSVSWVNELHEAVHSAKARNSSVYLISHIVPTEGMKNFVEELLATPQMTSVRTLFILDKKVGDVDVKNQQMQHIFKLDLTLSVIKDGVLGTIASVPLKLKSNIASSVTTNGSVLSNASVKYVGINLKDETLLPPEERRNDVGNIDYSGISNAGKQIMGLAQLDKDICKLIPDPILSWEVPENWSLEDAATVPHAYISAYYCLFEKARLEDGETVLIHSGCSPIGLAALSIATHHGCKIFTTVATEAQRNYLKKRFDIDDSNIFSSTDNKFEPYLLMATEGAGAHVIINNLSGTLLQSSVACLAEYGRFIQIGKYDLEESNSIGMSVFLKNTSFYVVDLGNVFLALDEVKKELRSLLQEGIKNRSVKPIERQVVEHQDVGQILTTLSNAENVGKIVMKVNDNLYLNKFILNNPSQFICDTKSSYLIYGGTSDLWIDVVEWLILRGARKVVVSSDSKSQQASIHRRVSLLRSYFQAEIVFVPNKAHTREGASELLSELYKLGPIHFVILLPNKTNTSRSETKSVQYLDHALRTTAPKAILVNFIKSAAGVCNLRAETGFSTYNIQWEKDLELNEVISGLDQILTYKFNAILVKNDRIGDSHQESAQALFQKLTLMLSHSLEDFIEDTLSAPSEPELVQLPTLGPRDMRELSPVFIIPGLFNHKELKDMAFELLYPTFCAVLPANPLPIADLAQQLVEKILKIWPKGAYNIIGVSWGGALMIEIAKILDKRGASLHLYFIDAAPETLQSTLKYLGEDDVNLETNLLTRLLKLTDDTVTKRVREATNWQSRVKLALDNLENSVSDKQALNDGLNTLKARLQNLMSYKPTEELVSGQIHLIRPTGASKYDNCGLVSYCKQTPQVTLVTGDHLSIINSPTTTEYINEKHYLI